MDWDTKQLLLDTPYDFELLFKLAHNSTLSKATFDLMLRSFAPTHKCNDDTTLPTSAVPATIRKNCKRLLASECCLHTNNHICIRLPGSEHFAIVGPARIIKNTNNNIAIHESDGLIVLADSNLNSTLTIKRFTKYDACPVIVSGIPGQACHKIKAINAPQFTLSEILESLVSCEELYVQKCIHIKQITCLDDAIEESVDHKKPCTFDDVYCCRSIGIDQTDEAPVNHIVLTKNKIHYHQCWDFNMPFSEAMHKSFNVINDNTAIITNLLQQFSTTENQMHNYSSVITTSEIVRQMKSTYSLVENC